MERNIHDEHNYISDDDAPPVAFEYLDNSSNKNNIKENNYNSYEDNNNIFNLLPNPEKEKNINQNIYKLNISIAPIELKKLSKDYLIDLIIFIKKFCQIKKIK